MEVITFSDDVHFENWLVFSKKEQAVGTWVDGSTVYTKTTITEISGAGSWEICDGLSKNIIGIMATAKRESKDVFTPVNAYRSSDNYDNIYTSNGSSYIETQSAGTVIATFFYTK